MLLVLGTHNRKKGVELEKLLQPFGFELKTLADYPNSIEVVEDGDSFEANARLKATQQAQHLNQWVIGEDSGLCVKALNGEPGIHSARFSGDDATDEKNNAELLHRLEGVPQAKRGAFYVCHVTLADPNGTVAIDCEDTCHGQIVTVPRGGGGFGYDPLFEIREYHKTFGELGSTVKSTLSHRSRAIRRFVPQLLHLAEKLDWDLAEAKKNGQAAN